MTNHDIRRTGFTLIEVVVAVAILAIAITSLLVVRSDTLKAAGETRDVTKAILLAQQVMGLTELAPPEGPEILSGEFGDHPGWWWQRETNEIELFVVSDEEGDEEGGEEGGEEGEKVDSVTTEEENKRGRVHEITVRIGKGATDVPVYTVTTFLPIPEEDEEENPALGK